ncbi:MAG: beta-galactosidase trimerization domain-containing protein, partial [Acidobacteriota bacterium]|nr:beta-galactosidase trimerization domain-containing protein [Acidobacteriota bacterium]
CYCEHCQRNFRDFSGIDLPRTANPLDPARRAYIGWRQKRLFDLWRLWDGKIKAINPHAAYIANAGGGALSELDMKTIGELAPTLFADRQARRGVMPPWSNGKNGKEYRAALGRKPIAGIFSIGLEEQYRWKDSVQSGDEIRLWVADGIAHDLRPWFTKFNAKPYDTRWLPVVEQLYNWHYRNERYLRNEKNLARAAMVYSQQTATFYGGEKAHAKVEDPALGFYHALVEARIPFEMVHDGMLDAEHIDRYRTLILPNIAALSSRQCEQLIAFVERGGSIVATYETSLYDEWGAKRADFGLASLFGASYAGGIAGGIEGPMQNSYLALEKDPATGGASPLLAGFKDTTRIVNGAYRVRVKPEGASLPSPFSIVPSYPDLPMEEVFPRPTGSREPALFVREHGRGRVVYFPFDIDRTFWEVLSPDHSRLLGNAVQWASNEEQPVTVKGAGILDLSVWTQKDSMTVHLVNLTNPMMMKGPVRELIPISDQQVSVQIPPGRRIASARLLVAGKAVSFRRRGRSVELEVPSISLHEVIALDFVS